MARLVALAVALVMWGSASGPAAAQGIDLTGAWSWTSPGQGGLDANTLMLNRDGTFVRVSRAPNGWLLRYVGVYRATLAGPQRVVVQSQVRDWNPKAMCSQIPSMGIRNCGRVPPPPGGSFELTIVSPTQMRLGGSTLFRDPNPFLLGAAVPAQYVRNEAAPAQPVAPRITPYDQSPVHRGMNDFVYGRLRGCNYKATGPNGTLYSGCDR